MYMTLSEKELFKNTFKDLIDEKTFEEMEIDKFRTDLLEKIILVKDNNCIVYSIDIDSNSYGEFLFITFKFREWIFKVYGFGIHIYRNKKYLKYFIINDISRIGTDSFNEKYYSKLVEKKYEFYKMFYLDRKETIEKIGMEKRTNEEKLFSMVADLTDDDYALYNSEEYEYLLGDN